MARNRKPWVHKRKNRAGWWVGWYDAEGRRHAKELPNKSLAEQFSSRKVLELNESHRPPGTAVPISWKQLVEEYIRSMRVRNLAPSSIGRVELTLSTFSGLMKITSPKHVTQRRLEDFILARRQQHTRFGKPPSEHSVNTDVRNLRGFLKWASDPKRAYLTGPFELHETKAQQRKPKALHDDKVAALLGLFNDTKLTQYPDAWRTRILLAGATGLRAGDIERLRPADFDPSDQTVRTVSKKTKKEFTKRPIPAAAWECVWPYVQTRLGEPRLFPDTFTSKTWTRIRRAVGLPTPLTAKEKSAGQPPPAQTFHFHDLRILFASALAAQHVPTSITQKLLEHSTPALTNQVYTDFDPTLRPAVETLPVADWLKEVKIESRCSLEKEHDHKDGSASCDSVTDSNQEEKSASE